MIGCLFTKTYTGYLNHVDNQQKTDENIQTEDIPSVVQIQLYNAQPCLFEYPKCAQLSPDKRRWMQVGEREWANYSNLTARSNTWVKNIQTEDTALVSTECSLGARGGCTFSACLFCWSSTILHNSFYSFLLFSLWRKVAWAYRKKTSSPPLNCLFLEALVALERWSAQQLEGLEPFFATQPVHLGLLLGAQQRSLRTFASSRPPLFFNLWTQNSNPH